MLMCVRLAVALQSKGGECSNHAINLYLSQIHSLNYLSFDLQVDTKIYFCLIIISDRKWQVFAAWNISGI